MVEARGLPILIITGFPKASPKNEPVAGNPCSIFAVSIEKTVK